MARRRVGGMFFVYLCLRNNKSMIVLEEVAFMEFEKLFEAAKLGVGLAR